VAWVVGVETLLLELAPAEGVVVGVLGGVAARGAVAVRLVGAHALRVAGEDAGPEAGLVSAAVAALPGAAAPLLGFGAAALAPAALVGELGAAGS
jgi:hypothetical protein